MRMMFEPEIESLTQVQELVTTKAKAFGLSEKKMKNLMLAVEEAFVNIVMHGMKDTKTSIQVVCFHDDLSFKVVFKDEGIPFNPLKAKVDLNLEAQLHERAEGGLGLYFIRQFVDDLEYVYENGFNCLILKQLK